MARLGLSLSGADPRRMLQIFQHPPVPAGASTAEQEASLQNVQVSHIDEARFIDAMGHLFPAGELATAHLQEPLPSTGDFQSPKITLVITIPERYRNKLTTTDRAALRRANFLRLLEGDRIEIQCSLDNLFPSIERVLRRLSARTGLSVDDELEQIRQSAMSIL